jgi:hypothetical protein
LGDAIRARIKRLSTNSRAKKLISHQLLNPEDSNTFKNENLLRFLKKRKSVNKTNADQKIIIELRPINPKTLKNSVIRATDRKMTRLA